MNKQEYSKRDYNKKIYLSGDKKDLRKSFPKWTMVAPQNNRQQELQTMLISYRII